MGAEWTGSERERERETRGRGCGCGRERETEEAMARERAMQRQREGASARVCAGVPEEGEEREAEPLLVHDLQGLHVEAAAQEDAQAPPQALLLGDDVVGPPLQGLLALRIRESVRA